VCITLIQRYRKQNLAVYYFVRSARELIRISHLQNDCAAVEYGTLVLIQIQFYAFRVEKGGMKGKGEGMEMGCSLKWMFWVCLTGVLGASLRLASAIDNICFTNDVIIS